jgi:hypothetical protein
MTDTDIVRQVAATGLTLRCEVTFRDSTTWQGKTGLTNASLTCGWSQPSAAASTISLVAGTIGGAYLSGSLKEIDATKRPGGYQFDIPVAVVAAGLEATITFHGTGVLDANINIAIVPYDPSAVDKTGFSLAATGYDLVDDQASAVETGLTRRGWRRLLASVLLGVESGRGSSITTYTNAVAQNKTRVTSHKDASNNRAVVTTDAT